MESKKGKNKKRFFWSLLVIGVLMSVGVAAHFFITVSSIKCPMKKRCIHKVTLLRPPPPPKPKEELPKPKPEMKKEKIVEEQQMESEPKDEPQKEAQNDSLDDDLGLDAAAGSGSDAFGLKAKKGGHPIIGGGGNWLMRKYGWYAGEVEETIRKRILDILDEKKIHSPEELTVIVRVHLDPEGHIKKINLMTPLDDSHMEDIFHKALSSIRISDPPPEGMPLGMKIKIRIRAQG